MSKNPRITNSEPRITDIGNIVLVGFMGAGKSSVGRRLAIRLKKDFVDTDQAIIRTAGMSIRKIFAQEGEERFRNRETVALKSFLDRKQIVLSTGGGIVLREENRLLLQKIGRVVWLTAKPDILFERAMRSQKRPLLQVSNPRQVFNSHLAARENFYRQVAHFRVDCSHSPHNEIVSKILEMFDSNGLMSN